MKRRTGATLVEVLVAIFVMGIGLMALLALFPLGALNMAQAIRDDRCGHAAQNAAAVANIMPQTQANGSPPPAGVYTGNYGVRSDPQVWPYYTTNPPTGMATPVGQSYPVYVDPFGAQLGSTVVGSPLAGMPGIRRSNLSYFTTPPANASSPARWLTLLDDITFGENGAPNPGGAGLVQREGRYSWAFLCQLPSANLGIAGASWSQLEQANLTVVVYDRRALLLGSGGSLTGENTYAATIPASATVSNVVTLAWNAGQDPPALRKGNWILDASPVGNSGQHAYFYQVVGTTQPSGYAAAGGNPNSMDVELQTDVQGFGGGTTNSGQVVVMEGVAAVVPIGPRQ